MSNQNNTPIKLGDKAFQIKAVSNAEQMYKVVDGQGKELNREQFSELFENQISAYRLAGDLDLEQRPKIISDGDSWSQILWPLSSLAGFQPNFVDMMEMERKYNITNFGWPGQPISQTVTKKDYQTSLKSGIYKFFIISGGGTDIIGTQAFARMLFNRSSIDPKKPVENWFDQNFVDQAYGEIEENYLKLAKEIKVWSRGKTRMIMHGYDYPIPRLEGPWLGSVLDVKGYDLHKDRALISEIMKFIIDRLYEVLENVQAQHSNSIIVDLRGVVRGRWTDEIHTNRAASSDIAELFMKQIDQYV